MLILSVKGYFKIIPILGQHFMRISGIWQRLNMFGPDHHATRQGGDHTRSPTWENISLNSPTSHFFTGRLTIQKDIDRSSIHLLWTYEKTSYRIHIQIHCWIASLSSDVLKCFWDLKIYEACKVYGVYILELLLETDTPTSAFVVWVFGMIWWLYNVSLRSLEMTGQILFTDCQNSLSAQLLNAGLNDRMKTSSHHVWRGGRGESVGVQTSPSSARAVSFLLNWMRALTDTAGIKLSSRPRPDHTKLN